MAGDGNPRVALRGAVLRAAAGARGGRRRALRALVGCGAASAQRRGRCSGGRPSLWSGVRKTRHLPALPCLRSLACATLPVPPLARCTHDVLTLLRIFVHNMSTRTKVHVLSCALRARLALPSPPACVHACLHRSRTLPRHPCRPLARRTRCAAAARRASTHV